MKWREQPKLSVVIPTLDEEASVTAAIESVRDEAEVIVVDGGSLDRTTSMAEAAGARVLGSIACRGRQLDVGARDTGSRARRGQSLERVSRRPEVVDGRKVGQSMKTARRLFWCAISGMAVLLMPSGAKAELFRSSPARPPARSQPEDARRLGISRSYGRMPLHFEANQGQTDAQVRFLSRGSGYSLFLTPTEAVLVLQKPTGTPSPGGPRPKPDLSKPSAPPSATAVVRMKFLGANPAPALRGVEELPGKSNYFLGNDRTKWRTGVPQFARVEYRDVYPGVSLIYYGNQRQLEYDFVVAPGADPGSIGLGIEGARRIRLDRDGGLVLETAGGELIQRAPLIYQEKEGVRTSVSGRYALRGRGQVGFEVGDYDTNRPLVIDPTLVYSTSSGERVAMEARASRSTR